MIDQTDAQLRDWLASILTGSTVSFAPPADAQTGRGVNLYLLDLLPKPPGGANRRLPLQLTLRYLVSTWAEEPVEAHNMLGILVLAAMENPEVEVELDPVPIAAWQALGVKPRPCFALRVPLHLDRPEPAAKLVRKPMVIKTTLLTSLQGIVLTPDNVPLAGARVGLSRFGLAGRTDSDGRFAFPAVPVEPRTKQLTVVAKGREMQFDVEQPSSEQGLVVVHFDIEEE